jgi:MFS family permease
VDGVVGDAPCADRRSTIESTKPLAASAADATSRNVKVLVAFTAVSNLADGVMKIALPLLATKLTKSPFLVSAVLLTLTLPWLFTALHLGVVVDRFDRRRLVWLANGIQITIAAILLGLAASQTLRLPVIYSCGIALGVAEVIGMTSAAALVPDAVASAGRERANVWMAGAETVCNEFAGPFIGGLLVGAGASFALGATLFGYVLSTVVLLFLVGQLRTAAAGRPESPHMHAQISEGLRFLWRQRLLRVITFGVAGLCSCWGAWYGVMPLYATQTMGLSAAEYGMLVGALGAGGILGTLIVGRLNRLLGRRWALMADVFLTCALVAAPAVTTNAWVVGCGAFLGGMGGTLWTVNVRTLGQALVPQDMSGRFWSVHQLFAFGSIPLGSALGGVLAEWFSAPVALAVFAASALFVFVPFVRAFTAGVEADIDNLLKLA